jgi:hypothetical protein
VPAQGTLRAADEIIDEGHFIGKARYCDKHFMSNVAGTFGHANVASVGEAFGGWNIKIIGKARVS